MKLRLGGSTKVFEIVVYIYKDLGSRDYGSGSLFKTFVLKFLLYTLFHLNIRINYRLLTCGLTRI